MFTSLESLKSLTKRVTLLNTDVSVTGLRGHLETKCCLFSLRRDLLFFIRLKNFSNAIQLFPVAMVAKLSDQCFEADGNRVSTQQ